MWASFLTPHGLLAQMGNRSGTNGSRLNVISSIQLWVQRRRKLQLSFLREKSQGSFLIGYVWADIYHWSDWDGWMLLKESRSRTGRKEGRGDKNSKCPLSSWMGENVTIWNVYWHRYRSEIWEQNPKDAKGLGFHVIKEQDFLGTVFFFSLQ